MYLFSDSGPTSISWGAHYVTPWEVSAASGTLAAGAQQTVTVTLNAAAAAMLPAGRHVCSIGFSNRTTTVTPAREFALLVGMPSTLTEVFPDGVPVDLAGSTLTFTPGPDPGTYSVCRLTGVSEYPNPITNIMSAGSLSTGATNGR